VNLAATAPRQHRDAAANAAHVQDQGAAVVVAAAAQPIEKTSAATAVAICRRGRQLKRAIAVIEVDRAAAIGANGVAQLGQDRAQVRALGVRHSSRAAV